MRVLLLAPGHSIHSQRFLGWLQNAGCDIVFMDTDRPPNLRPQDRYWHYPLPLQGIQRYFQAIYRFALLRGVSARFKPDVIHVHQVNQRALDCQRAALRPMVLTCWGTDINKYFTTDANPSMARRMGAALAQADHVFADSQPILDRCQALAGKAIQGSLLYFGVNTALFQANYQAEALAWRQELGIPANAFVIVSIRGWKEVYRHELILDAFAQALPHLPAPAILLFKPYPAEDSLYERRLRALAEERNVSQFIRWARTIPDERMPALYTLADLVVNYPAVDGFPVSFLEATAAGCPIVTSRLPDYLGNGLEEIVHLASPEDGSDLARAIIQASQEPHQAKAARARAWAREHADEQTCIRKLLEVYRQL